MVIIYSKKRKQKHRHWGLENKRKKKENEKKNLWTSEKEICVSLQNALPLRSFSLRHFSFPSFVSDVVTSSPIRAGSAHFVAHIWSQNCRSVARRNLRRPWSPWLQTGCSLSGLYGHWKGDEKGIQRKYLPLLRSVLCVRS